MIIFVPLCRRNFLKIKKSETVHSVLKQDPNTKDYYVKKKADFNMTKQNLCTFSEQFFLSSKQRTDTMIDEKWKLSACFGYYCWGVLKCWRTFFIWISQKQRFDWKCLGRVAEASSDCDWPESQIDNWILTPSQPRRLYEGDSDHRTVERFLLHDAQSFGAVEGNMVFNKPVNVVRP